MTDAEGNEIGKLFVGGLSQTTNNATLRVYFSQFGEIEDAVVMMDNKTGRSRGFGYVKYRDPDSVRTALNAKPHKLNGKEIDAKQCNINMKGRNHRSLKVFVGGISVEQDVASITAFFDQFGRVTDVNLMMDSNKQRHRGFAFVGFDDETVVNRLINMHYITMNNKQVEIKAMEPPNFGRKVGPILAPHHRLGEPSENLSRADCGSVSEGHNPDMLHSCHQTYHSGHMPCSPCVDPGGYTAPPHGLMTSHGYPGQTQTYMGPFPTDAGYGGRLIGDQYPSTGYAPGKMPTVPLIFANSFFPLTPAMYGGIPGSGCQHLGPGTAYPYPILQPKLLQPNMIPGTEDYWSHGSQGLGQQTSTANSASQTSPLSTRNHSLFGGSAAKNQRSTSQHPGPESEPGTSADAVHGQVNRGGYSNYFNPMDQSQGIWCLPPMQYPKSWVAGPAVNEQHTMGGLLQLHVEAPRSSEDDDDDTKQSAGIIAKPSGDHFDREDPADAAGLSIMKEEATDEAPKEDGSACAPGVSPSWVLQRPQAPPAWAFRAPCWGDVHGFGLPPGIILQPHAASWSTQAPYENSLDHAAVAAAMNGSYGYAFPGLQQPQQPGGDIATSATSFPTGGPSGIPELDGPFHVEQQQQHHQAYRSFFPGANSRHRRRDSPDSSASGFVGLNAKSPRAGPRWSVAQTASTAATNGVQPTTAIGGKKTSLDKDAAGSTNEKSSVAAGDHHHHHQQQQQQQQQQQHRGFRI